ncbi:MAG: hypothetical protein GX468_04205, partial [Thermotogaceae bacterium]|nr:hypothetical protein [Thermotogaceae bacterium]
VGEPIFSMLLSMLLLGERLSIIQAIGALLMSISIVLGVLQTSRPVQTDTIN